MLYKRIREEKGREKAERGERHIHKHRKAGIRPSVQYPGGVRHTEARVDIANTLATFTLRAHEDFVVRLSLAHQGKTLPTSRGSEALVLDTATSCGQHTSTQDFFTHGCLTWTAHIHPGLLHTRLPHVDSAYPPRTSSHSRALSCSTVGCDLIYIWFENHFKFPSHFLP